MLWPRLRASEWVLVAFFAYIALISPFFPERPNLGAQPFFILAAVFVLLWLVARFRLEVLRDFLPLGLTLLAFREMEFFLPRQYNLHFEMLWIRWDRLLLDSWNLRGIIEAADKLIPAYLELSYLLVYGLPFYCVGALYSTGHRKSCDRFLVIYLIGTLSAYALFPYFPSQPPRIAFPGLDVPAVNTVLRRFNLAILHAATIHVGVFPSAHVSSAFAAAWAMFLVLPRRKLFGWVLVVYAISVSLATIYGRYHYAADVVAGVGISLVAGLAALLIKGPARTVVT